MNLQVRATRIPEALNPNPRVLEGSNIYRQKGPLRLRVLALGV